jgi:hypothetical protein
MIFFQPYTVCMYSRRKPIYKCVSSLSLYSPTVTFSFIYRGLQNLYYINTSPGSYNITPLWKPFTIHYINLPLYLIDHPPCPWETPGWLGRKHLPLLPPFPVALSPAVVNTLPCLQESTKGLQQSGPSAWTLSDLLYRYILIYITGPPPLYSDRYTSPLLPVISGPLPE